MMRFWWLLFIPLVFIVFSTSPAHAQQGNTVLIRFAGVPSGSCSPVGVAVNNSNADFYDCTSGGTWNKVSGAGGTCPEGTCIVNAPAADQTISAHNLILQGPLATDFQTILRGSEVGGVDAIEVHMIQSLGESLYTHTSSAAFKAPTFGFLRSRGTQASPTAVQSGDQLGYINFGGYDGTSYFGGGTGVFATASENYGASHGSQLALSAVPIGGTGAASSLFLVGPTDLQTNTLLDLTVGQDKSASFPLASTPVFVNLWSHADGDNDMYTVLQAGHLTQARDYLAFLDFDGVVKWLTGKNGLNGPNSYILYDSIAGIHRMVMPSAANASGGATYIAAAGVNPVIINGNTGLDNLSATGGFQVWGGGTNGTNAAKRFVVTDAGTLQLGASGAVGISQGGTGATIRIGNGGAGDQSGTLEAAIVLANPAGTSPVKIGDAGFGYGGVDFNTAFTNPAIQGSANDTVLNAHTRLFFELNSTIFAYANGTYLNLLGTPLAWGTAFSTIDTGLSRDSAGVIDVGNGTATNKSGSVNLTNLTATGAVSGATELSATRCAATGTAASPSVASCSAARAGAFSCATNASAATCTVNTTAVTANSTIIVQESAAEGTPIGVTCNTAPTVTPAILLSAKVAATSFTINMPTITVNPACFVYEIIN